MRLIRLPLVNPNEDLVLLATWTRQAREFVRAGDVIAELETSKAAFQLESEGDGYLLPLAEPGTWLAVGSPIAALLERANEEAPVLPGPSPEPTVPYARQGWTMKAQALARRHGIRPEAIVKEGPVTERDIDDYIAKARVSPLQEHRAEPMAAPAPLDNPLRYPGYNSNAQGLILMGSDDSGMGPLTAHRPKAFLPVAGHPWLERQLEACARAGLARVTVIYGGQHREALAAYLGKGNWWGMAVSLTAEPAEPNMGMAPANSALADSPILIMLGDLLVSPQDLQGLLAQPGPARGVAGAGASSRVPMFRVPAKAWPRLVPLSPAELEAGFDRLSQDGLAVTDYPLAFPWLRLAHPWDLLAAAEVLLAGLQPRIGDHSVIESGVTMKGPVEVGPRSVIRSGVYIEGPVRIGADCDIGPNCYIRPATAIGDRCHIGAAVEIKNSLIFSGTAVPHLSYVGDSIIAEDCNLGGGTVITNLRPDDRPVWMLGMNTGRRKLGAVIGARVKTGINVSIGRPGTVIGNDCSIAAGAVVLRDLPDGAVVNAGVGRSEAKEPW